MNVWAAVQFHFQRAYVQREEAKAIRGQLLQQPRSKEDLLAELARYHQTPTKGSLCHTLIFDYYPPCQKPYSALRKLSISQLRIGTHHAGEVLIARLIAKPIKIGGCLSIIEDEDGQAAKLSAYHHYREADEVLPEGARIAIKQPFFQAVGTTEFFVRVDHPSDLVLIDAKPVRMTRTR